VAYKVFIDGQEGTTGLQIFDRLNARPDITILPISQELRKDPQERRRLMMEADVVFFCLPDAAAVESAALAEGSDAIVIDASTAHRTNPDWAYGFPELSAEHRAKIATGKRIANPGCHATGFISLVYPLVKSGLIDKEALLSSHSITGYSGGGKSMIQDYEGAERDAALDSPRQYALTLKHKHLPEMAKITGLSTPPVFNPIVADFYKGMAVSLPLFAKQLQKPMTKAELLSFYQEFYAGSTFITVSEEPAGMIAANEYAGTNHLHIYVCGNDETFTLVSVFDNLGKGASGAAVQNMNIALGLPEDTYLV